MFESKLWKEINEVVSKRKTLEIIDFDDDSVLIEGVFELSDSAGVFDAFDTTIKVSSSFPWKYPRVFETSGRVIRDAHHHCMPEGFACLSSWPVWLAANDNLSFEAVINGPIADWFLSQSIFERKGEWIYGELEHGIYGQLQAMGDLLKIEAPIDIKNKLELLGFSLKINSGLVVFLEGQKGHIKCFCESGSRYRDCHREHIKKLKSDITFSRRKFLMDHAVWLSKQVNKLP
ncbi:MAG: hypothetical protein V7676_12245 [Parasphingorhabdus sp.]|uniref:hypothetical protein n=1 Tax=Parasphingorhabdus sp. TaxID=2709688 RepID=UPI003003580B